MPDAKKQIEEINKEEAKEKAALQKQLEAPGPRGASRLDSESTGVRASWPGFKRKL